MNRGSSRGPIGRIASVGTVEGPNVIGRIRMIQRIASLDLVRLPGSVHRSFQEILENRAWGSGAVPERYAATAMAPVADRRPLPPTREELEESLEDAQASSFLARLARKLL